MAVALRLRQLRRDKTVFALVMNISRLQVEEDAYLSQALPAREAPEAELLRIQQAADQWVHLATTYIMQKHRCQLAQAMQLLGELRIELGRNIPVEEVCRIPLSVALNLPAEASVSGS